MAELLELLGDLGFTELRLTDLYDCFRGTSKERVARKFGVNGIGLFARKPEIPRSLP